MPSGVSGDSHVSVSVACIEAVSTLERREGRKRSPHRGNTALSWPTVASFPGVAANPIDPFSQSDPWRGYASQRSQAVHSRMSTKLERDRETLDAFLADIEGVSLPPIPIPVPVVPDDSASVSRALLEGQTALLQGVNELRANQRSDIAKHISCIAYTFFQALVQADTAPLQQCRRGCVRV